MGATIAWRAAVSEGAKARDLPFQLRGNTYTMMVLKILNPDNPGFYEFLVTKVRQAPDFFRDAPVVADIDDIDRVDFDFAALRQGLMEHSLILVGIQGGNRALQAAALRSGLPVIPAARTPQPMSLRREPRATAPAQVEPSRVPESAAPASAGMTSLIRPEPVRSGQQIYAPGADLVVLGAVSAGAEVLADGNIHVYGALRGRALAGVSGDVHARIFTSSLGAELVSVAGFYRVSDDIDSSGLRGKPAQIWLDGESLRVESLG